MFKHFWYKRKLIGSVFYSPYHKSNWTNWRRGFNIQFFIKEVHFNLAILFPRFFRVRLTKEK